MFGLPDGVPVAAYGPRGSEQAVANIRRAVRPGVPAVLLANHGVLVFHRTAELAVLVGGVVEEAAQAAINARRWAVRSRSRATCGPPRSSGRWRSTRRGRRPPDARRLRGTPGGKVAGATTSVPTPRSPNPGIIQPD